MFILDLLVILALLHETQLLLQVLVLREQLLDLRVLLLRIALRTHQLEVLHPQLVHLEQQQLVLVRQQALLLEQLLKLLALQAVTRLHLLQGQQLIGLHLHFLLQLLAHVSPQVDFHL